MSESNNRIAVKCSCGKRLRAKASLAGKTVRCPACKAKKLVPTIRDLLVGALREEYPELVEPKKAPLTMGVMREHVPRIAASPASGRVKILDDLLERCGRRAVFLLMRADLLQALGKKDWVCMDRLKPARLPRASSAASSTSDRGLDPRLT